ncbi:MAG: DNA polymerase/3'-5' exonuclease PolX [Candidatus Omnitrophica bacterium]|nr:DNA polymerase/3'-5' exonuclease PolX [Candidatus Omnitrophota bacterium]
MINTEIAEIFRQIAQILEIKGENVFKIRAYERAAQNIEGLTEGLKNIAKEGRLTEISGIGKDLSNKINEFIKTGRIQAYEDLKKSIPGGLLELLNIPSVGPKTVKLLYEQLKIKNILDLEKAIAGGKLKGIFGIKEKTIENISKGIELLNRSSERMTLAQATLLTEEFLKSLKDIPGVKEVSCAGSLRRQKDTVRDIDILVTSDKPQDLMDAFVRLPPVKDIIAHGETKSAVRTKDDVQVDCRVVEDRSFGAALVYFTGAKNFNIKLRHLAIKKGLKVNEYGVFRKERFVSGRSEEELLKTLGMQYIPPELREDGGEIELALKNKLPHLIELSDIKGDLHVHSNWSDGSNSIAEMVEGCVKRGYRYAAITDHSQSLKVAHGLSIADLNKKRLEIERLNKKLRNFTVLFGTEVEIDSEGNIDYKDGVLKDFDVVVAAIHSGFKQSKEQLTRRMIKACKNKYVRIIAHPFGRLWGAREPYELDLDEILKVARETNTHLEINSFPDRLDLNDIHAHRAKEMGVKLAINTDAHALEQLGTIKYGLAMARRGWLSAEDVINTLPLDILLKELKK